MPAHAGTDPEGTEDDDTTPFIYSASVAPGDEGMLDLLRGGQVEVLGLMPWSSNGTYLVQVRRDDEHAPAIYKPERGERPLWDFPGGLWRREVAAFELSEAMGLGLVPPTVARTNGPLGPGSLQAFVPARFEQHYFTMRDAVRFDDVLRALCAFDLVANSADRKGGHVLIDDRDRIWAIDNGLCFHAEFKVRTVIWDFAGEPLPSGLASAIAGLTAPGALDGLVPLLDDHELDALRERANDLLSTGRFPHDPTGRRYPWPLV